MQHPESESKPAETSKQSRDLIGFLGVAALLLLLLLGLSFFWDEMPWAAPKTVDDIVAAADLRVDRVKEDLVDAKGQLSLEKKRLALEKEQSALDREELAREKEKAKQQFLSYVGVRLNVHEVRIELAEKALQESVSEYFETRKSRIPRYAEKAQSWGNRWDSVWSPEEFREELSDLFTENVLSSSEMNEALSNYLRTYLHSVSLEEQLLFTNIRMKLNEFPSMSEQAQLDEAAFEKRIAAYLDKAAISVRNSTSVNASTGALAIAYHFFGGDLIDDVAEAISETEMGQEITKQLVGWLIDRITSYVGELYLTEDEIESSALRLMDHLRVVLMKGESDAWDEYEALEIKAKDDPDEEVRKEAWDQMQKMRNEGALGLSEVLEFIRDRNIKQKTVIMRRFAVEL
jgi:hypothetical protein